MARLLGRMAPSWCRSCSHEPGIDCPDYGRDKRSQRVLEKRQWRREVASWLG